MTGTAQAWLALRWETHCWVSSIPPDLVSRSVRERHAGPYQAATVPAIADLVPILPSATLAIADEASIEIFGSILLRSESASSSRTENLTSRIGMSHRQTKRTRSVMDAGSPAR